MRHHEIGHQLLMGERLVTLLDRPVVAGRLHDGHYRIVKQAQHLDVVERGRHCNTTAVDLAGLGQIVLHFRHIAALVDQELTLRVVIEDHKGSQFYREALWSRFALYLGSPRGQRTLLLMK